MGISSSLYSSISGLNTLGNSMSVIGDNVANVSTLAFKAARATFQDVLSQTVATAAGSSQVGRGTTLSAVAGLFAQGSFESSSQPTDMAIGGEGFFMVRSGQSNRSYLTRAGEFRFDENGYLVNPAGYFTQGWNVDDDTGSITGTLTDIFIAKSTEPVATSEISVITNLDARVVSEDTEDRLFDSWDGRRLAAVNPTAPISSLDYEYTSAIKVYDSLGTPHDLTIYFDRTSNENEWEYLVTCDPSEDKRLLDATEQTKYGAANYNYTVHKGAGAVLYGTLDFTTAGSLTGMSAYTVPPDAQVDPALNINRLSLETGEPYYSFPVNFVNSPEDQMVELNFGATFIGDQTNQTQVLVSEDGAVTLTGTGTEPITADTLWTDVYDSAGNVVAALDVYDYTGYDHSGAVVANTYTVVAGTTVQDLLDQLATDFGCTATIDAEGRIRLEDTVGGTSGMYVNSFVVTTGTADPFGAGINITTTKKEVITIGQALASAAGSPPISADTSWSSVYDNTGTVVPAGDTITIIGTKSDNTAVTSTYTVVANDTVQDLLDTLEADFECDAYINGAGCLVLRDWAADATSQLDITSLAWTSGNEAFAPAVGAQKITIAADTAEDGSREGAAVTESFVNEALTTTQYSNNSTTTFQDQDGFSAGFLQSVSVDTEGVITGHFSNGQVLRKAKVALATVTNLQGLQKEGGSLFSETTESGTITYGEAGNTGLGTIAPNSLEQSNVDLGTEFVRLITTQRGFQANAKIISTTDEMMSDLINLKR